MGFRSRACLCLALLIHVPPPPEWRNLATHCGHADMLQFLQDVDACIFREIVAQDSLYVRI